MERINLVELLKDCPLGMELDCTMYEDVCFYEITDDPIFPIHIKRIDGAHITLTKYGEYADSPSAKCVIFPKGKTTWEGFVPPFKFKDGDVITCTNSVCSFVAIFKEGNTDITFRRYVSLTLDPVQQFWTKEGWCDFSNPRLATEEEKRELFDAIKANGYKWNEETKTLERSVEPLFKDGDILYCNANDDGENKDMFKYIFIFDKIVDIDGTKFYYSHCHLFGSEFYDTKANLVHNYSVRFATEEEKQKLFNAIKENGYKWNPETKTLVKLIQPKFKVGDRIKNKTSIWSANRTIKSYDKNIGYFTTINDWVRIEDQDDWELVPDKFDISTLVSFESKVLVRNDKDQYWIPAFWGYKCADGYTTTYGWCKYCIPFDGNEHLLESNKECDKFYRTWEKTGD